MRAPTAGTTAAPVPRFQHRLAAARYVARVARRPSGCACLHTVTAARVSAAVVCAVACLVAGLGAAAAARANLLRNPGAEAGAASAQGWDSVTIPGWTVAAGLPTVVRYGTQEFPTAGAHADASAVVRRRARRDRSPRAVGAAAGAPARVRLPAGTPYELSARLGASSSSRASVSVAFVSAHGQAAGSPCSAWCRRVRPVVGATRLTPAIAARAAARRSGRAPR